jgi:hypothetical protein
MTLAETVSWPQAAVYIAVMVCMTVVICFCMYYAFRAKW